MIPRFLDLMDIDFFLVALPYTLLDTDILDREFPLCAARGVGFGHRRPVRLWDSCRRTRFRSGPTTKQTRRPRIPGVM